MKKVIGRSLLLLLLIFLIAGIGFVIWGETPSAPMPEAIAALQPNATVKVEQGQWLVFTPTEGQPKTGLIFYPGGRVDYRSYAPAAREIAAHGYLVVIVRMPLNLAILGASRAEEVIAAYPGVQHWVIGGHSLGGAMAANFAKNHPDEISGLALWAAYPAASDDLSGSGLSVTSVYGSQDGLATGEKIDASRALLPADTTWVEIRGGNHAQFGWYGEQSGDKAPEISREEQQGQSIAATLGLLDKLS